MGQNSIILILRLFLLIIMVVMLMVQVKSIRVFRFELIVSEGLIITYIIAHVGLALSASNEKCVAFIFQEYLMAFGVVLFGINAVVLGAKWLSLDEMTYAVIELLQALDLNVRFQMYVKIALNIILLILMTMNLILTPFVIMDGKGHLYIEYFGF